MTANVTRLDDLGEQTTAYTIRHRLATAAILPFLLGAGVGILPSAHVFVDRGSRTTPRIYASRLFDQTTLDRVVLDAPVEAEVQPTRMGRLLRMAPLTRRTWAKVFGVTASAVQKWVAADPPRERLQEVLNLVSSAQAHQADMAQWLTTPLGDSQATTPLKLLELGRDGAFVGASRLAPRVELSLKADQVLVRRHEVLPWAVPETPITPDET